MTPRRESRYNIEALSRGLEVLELFTFERPSLTLTEIVEALRSNKSTVFRVLSTLETKGYLDHDPVTRRYQPAIKVLQLGFRAINSLEVRQVARPYLERLAQEMEETVSLAILDGTNMVYIDRVRNRAIVGVVLDIGSRLPAHSTSLGKVLLAGLPPDDLQDLLEGMDFIKCTSFTIADREALLAELAKVRNNGYAVCDGELAVGLKAVAAPIRDSSMKTVAAVNVSGAEPTISMERIEKEIAPALKATAERISLALGCPCDGGRDRVLR